MEVEKNLRELLHSHSLYIYDKKYENNHNLRNVDIDELVEQFISTTALKIVQDDNFIIIHINDSFYTLVIDWRNREIFSKFMIRYFLQANNLYKYEHIIKGTIYTLYMIEYLKYLPKSVEFLKLDYPKEISREIDYMIDLKPINVHTLIVNNIEMKVEIEEFLEMINEEFSHDESYFTFDKVIVLSFDVISLDNNRIIVQTSERDYFHHLLKLFPNLEKLQIRDYFEEPDEDTIKLLNDKNIELIDYSVDLSLTKKEVMIKSASKR